MVLNLIQIFSGGHVWTEKQYIAFVEYLLKGGKTNLILLNSTDYESNNGWYVCVDGLQRLTAVMKFTNNEIKAFGHYYNEFTGVLSAVRYGLNISVNNLSTRKEVLEWYIELNTGGTVHSEDEIERVKGLIQKESL